MSVLLSIDPGLSTGIALGEYTATEPYRRIASWQPRGGLAGFLAWWEQERPEFDEAVAEKFVPLDHAAFGHTLDSTLPLVIEGAIVALGIMPSYPEGDWARASAQYFMAAPGDPLAVKKKKAQEFLKRHGLWATGKPYGHTDGADVNSATLHAIASLRRARHMPTLLAYSGSRPPGLAA